MGMASSISRPSKQPPAGAWRRRSSEKLASERNIGHEHRNDAHHYSHYRAVRTALVPESLAGPGPAPEALSPARRVYKQRAPARRRAEPAAECAGILPLA